MTEKEQFVVDGERLFQMFKDKGCDDGSMVFDLQSVKKFINRCLLPIQHPNKIEEAIPRVLIVDNLEMFNLNIF